MAWVMDFVMNIKLFFILGLIFSILFWFFNNVSFLNSISAITTIFLLFSFFTGALFTFIGYKGYD